MMREAGKHGAGEAGHDARLGFGRRRVN
jgi:hypothetical protein